jgi:hypothetical protein
MPTRRQLQEKMNEQREKEFRPRFWRTEGNRPINKESMAIAIAEADEPKVEFHELDLPEMNEIVDNPPEGLVITDDSPIAIIDKD